MTSFDFAEAVDMMAKPGVTVMQFCGVTVDEDNFCDQEAEGEILAQMEDGPVIPIPVCAGHLAVIFKEYEVEELNNDVI